MPLQGETADGDADEPTVARHSVPLNHVDILPMIMTAINSFLLAVAVVQLLAVFYDGNGHGTRHVRQPSTW